MLVICQPVCYDTPAALWLTNCDLCVIIHAAIWKAPTRSTSVSDYNRHAKCGAIEPTKFSSLQKKSPGKARSRSTPLTNCSPTPVYTLPFLSTGFPKHCWGERKVSFYTEALGTLWVAQDHKTGRNVLLLLPRLHNVVPFCVLQRQYWSTMFSHVTCAL